MLAENCHILRLVKLWSIQAEPAIDALSRRGYLRGDGRRVDGFMRPAYRWMGAQLARRVAPPSGHNGYPVWAWRQFDGVARPRPDLRTGGLLPSGTRGVLVTLELPASDVLLSDFQKWHAVLNRSYLPRTMADARRFENDLARAEIADGWPYPEPFHSRVVASWQRIFELDAPASDCWEGADEREIQAVFWQLNLDDVKRMKRFLAR